jgi:hypothetical protein
MTEIAAHPEHAPLWLSANRGRAADLRPILDLYSAAVDWPACVFWRELLAMYPAARVILTIRDASGWYESFASTILPRIENLAPIASPGVRALYDVGREIVSERTFAGRAGDQRHAVAAYQAHYAEVGAAVEPDRLLTYDVNAGWEPLCTFLGVPVPEKPFPRANSRASFATGLRTRIPGRTQKAAPPR